VARLLVITAAWTGCRWGELAALHRDNLDLDAGRLVVDAEVGSLHESRGRRWLGPPKTPSSARTIVLPSFLVRLLRRHLETHPFEFVFTNACGTWLWRSSFDRRVLRPADRRWWQGRVAAVCGPARVDVLRAATQPQDVADRRGCAGDRGCWLICSVVGRRRPVARTRRGRGRSRQGKVGRGRLRRQNAPEQVRLPPSPLREGQRQWHRPRAAATWRQTSCGPERGAPETPQEGHLCTCRSGSPKIGPGREETPPTGRNNLIEGVLQECGAKGTRTPDPLTASEGQSWF
jgi:hypothetical protein